MPEKKVSFDEFVLDFGRFQLTRSGRPVHIEGLPLQLLMFLVNQPGSLVSREQISSELWSKDVFVDVETSINTAVRKVRQALGDDSEQPRYLQTVVGRGYRFIASVTENNSVGEPLMVSAEDLGRAIMAAAGIDPDNPKGDPKPPRGT